MEWESTVIARTIGGNDEDEQDSEAMHRAIYIHDVYSHKSVADI